MITNHTRESLVEFERGIRLLFANGELPFLVHLSGGNEGQLLDIFQDIKAEDWVFSTHRSHYHALLKGIPADELERKIVEGRSMFIFDRERRFVTSSILGGICAMAAGVALAIKQSGGNAKVWAFIGDGAEDNGHTYEAIRFVTGWDLPCTFVIEDNDRQVDTGFVERWRTRERFNWEAAMSRIVYTGSGVQVDLSKHVRRYHYTPTFPHGGAGLPAGSVKFKPEAIERYLAGQRLTA